MAIGGLQARLTDAMGPAGHGPAARASPNDRYFQSHARSLTSPPENAVAIRASDAGTLAVVTRALYVGSAGDLVVRMAGGNAFVTLANVAAGSLLPIRVDRVLATGTSAGSLLGLW